MRRVSGRNLLPFAGVAGVERGFHRTGEAPYGDDQEGIRREAHRLPQHRADLLRRDRRHGRRHGLPHDAGRRRQARAGLEIAQLRLCQRHQSETAPVAAQLQALGRHCVPFLEPQLGRMAADGGQIRQMALFGRNAGRGHQPLHGLRDVRGASDGGYGNLRIHAGAPQSDPRQEERHGVRHRKRGRQEVPAGVRTPLSARNVVGRRGARRDGVARQRVAE